MRKEMEKDLSRFEPVTSRLKSRYSTMAAYKNVKT
jgi:hypothetical protein